MTKPAFEHVVRRHGSTVLRVCQAVLGPTPAADDAWSEAFLSALQAYPDVQPDHLEGWLVTIAHRKAIDIVRARTRHAIPVAAVPDAMRSVQGQPPSAGDPGTDPDLHPDTELLAAVAALPPRQRDAVTLHHVAGLPHDEVADVLDSTSTAVRKASSDGIATLRRVLLARTRRQPPNPTPMEGTRDE